MTTFEVWKTFEPDNYYRYIIAIITIVDNLKVFILGELPEDAFS